VAIPRRSPVAAISISGHAVTNHIFVLLPGISCYWWDPVRIQQQRMADRQGES
jgi:hypothetical protein